MNRLYETIYKIRAQIRIVHICGSSINEVVKNTGHEVSAQAIGVRRHNEVTGDDLSSKDNNRNTEIMHNLSEKNDHK